MVATPLQAPAPAPPLRRRGRVGLVAGLAGGVALLGVLSLTALLGGGLGCIGGGGGGGGSGPAPSKSALRDIPRNYLRLYREMGTRYNIDWTFLASIGAQESNHGRAPGTNRVNESGCVGPMQLGTGGACGDFVGAWGQDGDRDGDIDPRNPADAIATAANGLRKGKGAPPIGGSYAAYRKAACGYYGACSDAHVNYADEVMTRAVQYGFHGAGAPAPTHAGTAAPVSGGGCGGGELGGGDPDAVALVHNKNITFAHSEEKRDLETGRISPRLVALLSSIAAGHKILIFALASDHSPGTNHEAGRAADIAIVDGDNCYPPNRSGACWALAQQLDRIKDRCRHPTELIYYFDPGPSPDSFPRADHDDHIHVGYDGPLGPKHYAADVDPCSPEAIKGSKE